MNTNSQQRKHAYRWVVLVIVFLTQVILNIDMFQLAGLAAKIIPDTGLRPNEFAMVLSVPLLTCAILGIVSGALADRFGVKIVIGIGLIISAAATVFRINANDFLTLFLWMLTLGVGMAALNSNAAKILGAWFGHEQMGMAMGIYVAAANVGISIALSTSALFPSVNTAFTISAVISVIMTVLWFLFVRSQPEDAPAESTQSMFSYLGVAGKSKGVWAGAIAMFFFMGSYVTHSGFLSNALTKSKGISPVTAGLAASVLSLSLIVGTVIVPLIYAKSGSCFSFLRVWLSCVIHGDSICTAIFKTIVFPVQYA